MMPLDFRRGPDLRRLGDSSPIVATKSEQAGEANATIDRIAKKGAGSSQHLFFH